MKTLKRWWGRLEKRRVATESGGDETGDKTGGLGGSGNETGDKAATTAGDERDGGDRWGNVCERGELEFDEDEMAALEGQCLVAEFTRCTKWPGQPSIIDPVTNAANVKKSLCI